MDGTSVKPAPTAPVAAVAAVRNLRRLRLDFARIVNRDRSSNSLCASRGKGTSR
jgi:hypothetical protein